MEVFHTWFSQTEMRPVQPLPCPGRAAPEALGLWGSALRASQGTRDLPTGLDLWAALLPTCRPS